MGGKANKTDEAIAVAKNTPVAGIILFLNEHYTEDILSTDVMLCPLLHTVIFYKIDYRGELNEVFY